MPGGLRTGGENPEGRSPPPQEPDHGTEAQKPILTFQTIKTKPLPGGKNGMQPDDDRAVLDRGLASPDLPQFAVLPTPDGDSQSNEDPLPWTKTGKSGKLLRKALK